MLNITGLNHFFFVRDFHDMRCKYDKVLSIIHQQLNREPEDGDVFIVMSKDLRLVRLFSYDRRSYSMFEKRFRPGYKFMQVTYNRESVKRSVRSKRTIHVTRMISTALPNPSAPACHNLVRLMRRKRILNQNQKKPVFIVKDFLIAL